MQFMMVLHVRDIADECEAANEKLLPGQENLLIKMPIFLKCWKP